MKFKRLPAGFIIPRPAGHGSTRPVPIRSRTARSSVIAAAAEPIKAESFTIDGESVVLGLDGLSRFEELRRRAPSITKVEKDPTDLLLWIAENERSAPEGRPMIATIHVTYRLSAAKMTAEVSSGVAFMIGSHFDRPSRDM